MRTPTRCQLGYVNKARTYPTLSEPLLLVSVAELAGLMLAGGSARGDNGAVQAGLSDDVDLDGGVTTRVVDGASVNLGDGHSTGSS